MSQSDELLPCPCCAGKASFQAIPIPTDESEMHANAGGEFIECEACGLTTNLMFPIKDDVRRQLAEKWNARARLAQPEAPRQYSPGELHEVAINTFVPTDFYKNQALGDLICALERPDGWKPEVVMAGGIVVPALGEHAEATASTTVGQPETVNYDYTRTFNAIAAAAKIEGTGLAISCAKFWEVYGAASVEQPEVAGDDPIGDAQRPDAVAKYGHGWERRVGDRRAKPEEAAESVGEVDIRDSAFDGHMRGHLIVLFKASPQAPRGQYKVYAAPVAAQPTDVERWKCFITSPSYFSGCWFPEDYVQRADELLAAAARGENPAKVAVAAQPAESRPMVLRDLIWEFERRAANTDTSPYWRAASALREIEGWQGTSFVAAQPDALAEELERILGMKVEYDATGEPNESVFEADLVAFVLRNMDAIISALRGKHG